MPTDTAGSLDLPPRQSMDDPGAHELGRTIPSVVIRDMADKDSSTESSDSDDHFSDAQSAQSGHDATILSARVEKAGDETSHGEILAADPYNIQKNDTVDGGQAASEERKSLSVSAPSRPSTPGGYPIPTTVVEKVDPMSPSHGEVPGTDAYELRKADAAPDAILKTPTQGSRSSSISAGSRSRAGSTPGDLPIPLTRVERVDSNPAHGEVPGTDAFEMRKEDAEPDVEEVVGDVKGTLINPFPSAPLTQSVPTSPSRSSPVVEHEQDGLVLPTSAHEPVEDYDDEHDQVHDDDGFGDDFDDFEDGAEDDDFGDFDEGFQEAETVAPTPQLMPTIAPSFVSSKQINGATHCTSTWFN